MTSRDGTHAGIRYAVDEHPPHLLAAGLGFQVVVLILAGIVLTPIIVLRSANTSLEYTSWVVFAALCVCGITTIIQARPIGPIGAGYVLYMGTSGAFLAVSVTAVERGGLPLLATLVVGASLFQFLFASRLALLRKIITPTVGGTVIMLIAVTVFPFIFKMLTDVPEGVDPGSAAAPMTAIATFVASVGVTLFASGQMRLWGPLIGVILGCIVASFYGLFDLTGFREASWIGLPSIVFPGPDLSFDWRLWGLLPAFLIVTLVGAIETFGDGIAIQRVSARKQKPVDFKIVQGAVYADGLGNMISGLAGTMPNTTYSTSVAVADLTGVASRRVGIYGGGFMIALAFLPKVSALLQAIPNPVIAAYATILLVLLFIHGLRLIFEGGLSYENGFVAGTAFWLGVGFQNRLIFPDHLPGWAHTLLDNGMTSGGLAAVVMTAILAVKNRSTGRVTLEASPSGIPRLHDFLGDLATRTGWDKAAIDRLNLAGEEAVLFLIDRQQTDKRRKANPIRVSARESAGAIELELISGPGAENIETLVDELNEDATGSVEEAGLRILKQLVREVRHLQFHQGDVLQITVESKPLG
jgi:NCS2 family nucleobase:cation symporter-2/xanthine permease XanP